MVKVLAEQQAARGGKAMDVHKQAVIEERNRASGVWQTYQGIHRGLPHLSICIPQLGSCLVTAFDDEDLVSTTRSLLLADVIGLVSRI